MFKHLPSPQYLHPPIFIAQKIYQPQIPHKAILSEKKTWCLHFVFFGIEDKLLFNNTYLYCSGIARVVFYQPSFNRSLNQV